MAKTKNSSSILTVTAPEKKGRRGTGRCGDPREPMEHVFCSGVIRTLDSEGFSLSFKKEMCFYHPTSMAGGETVLIIFVTSSGRVWFLRVSLWLVM